MIPALLLGRKGSKGFPGKNTTEVLGHPLAYYPIKAALDTPEIDKVFLSTDDPALVNLGESLGIEIIHRPDYLCGDGALGEDAFLHGYEKIKADHSPNPIDFAVLLMCNAAMIRPETISEGIRYLRDNPTVDSAVTVSRYNMWSPLRARKLDEDGLLKSFVPLDVFGDVGVLNCDRDSQGDVFFADMGVSVVRARCLENLSGGDLPMKWMGKKIHPLKQEAGCDVDYEWQLPVVEWWLKKYDAGRRS